MDGLTPEQHDGPTDGDDHGPWREAKPLTLEGCYIITPKQAMAVKWLIENCAWLPAQTGLSREIMDLSRVLRDVPEPERKE